MVTAKEIIDLVQKYLSTNDLDSFAATFAELFYDIETTGDPYAIELAYNIEASLAALSAGACNESNFNAYLKEQLPATQYHLMEPITELITGLFICDSDSITTYWLGAGSGMAYPARVGISLSMGFGSTPVPLERSQTNTVLPLLAQSTAAI
jgi:hypothetical protein